MWRRMDFSARKCCYPQYINIKEQKIRLLDDPVFSSDFNPMDICVE